MSGTQESARPCMHDACTCRATPARDHGSDRHRQAAVRSGQAAGQQAPQRTCDCGRPCCR
jgi:hypothetical protein